jgi:ADP-ribosyl-[dinitrogen reductase] hydrolase
MSSTMDERAAGCLWGGALGDAWGGKFENSSIKSKFYMPRNACVSDNTQFTLATCEALMQTGLVSPEAIAATFCQWYRERKFRGMGSSTLKAMRDLHLGAHWALAGAKGEFSAGNGAAMRIAPLAFVVPFSLPKGRQVVRDVARITHHSEEAYVGALAVGLAIQTILAGVWPGPRNLLSLVAEQLPDSRVRERILAVNETSGTIAQIAEMFENSGYVVDTVPLALGAAQKGVSQSMASILTEVIEIGGDTDTTASITGQVVGALVGRHALESSWLSTLSEREHLQEHIEQFALWVAEEPERWHSTSVSCIQTRRSSRWDKACAWFQLWFV